MSNRSPDVPSVRPDPAQPRVLVADDQADVLEALRLLLKSEGYRIDSAHSPAANLEAIDAEEFDAVLMDLNYTRDTTSGQEGLDLLSQLRTPIRRCRSASGRRGAAWKWRSRRCAAARETSCRSRGRTRGSSRSCGRRSNWR